MASCEKCWEHARLHSYGSYFAQRDMYSKLLKTCICTLKEQAGQYWDEKYQVDRRDFLSVKPKQKTRYSLNKKWGRERRGK